MGRLTFVTVVMLLVVGVISFVRGVTRQRAYRRQRRRGELSTLAQSPAPKPPRAVPEGRRRLDTDGLVSLSIGTLVVLVTGALVLESLGLSRLVVAGLPVAVVGGALVWLYTDRS